MKIIKFRAWDKVMNEMFYDSELSSGDILIIHIDGRLELSDDDTYKVTDFELMEFTNLLDKNQVEIYEKDIVKAFKHNEEEFTHQIVWRGGSLWFGNWNWIEFQNIFRSIEVVGNVYENGELLDIKKGGE